MQQETLKNSDSETWISRICDGLQYGRRVLEPVSNVDGIEDLRQHIRKCMRVIAMANNRYHQLAGHELFNNEIHDSLKIELEKLNTDILPILNTISESSPQTQGSEKYVVDKEQYESITSAIGEITASCLDRLDGMYSVACERITTWETLPPATALPALPPPDGACINTEPQSPRVITFPSLWTKAQKFEYSPLEHADSIRLLKIVSIYPRVRCEMESTRLGDLPSYNALSYAWGDSKEKASISCNGRLFDVTPNLKEGMRRLFKYTQRHGGRRSWTGYEHTDDQWRFWIDQICIDQGNTNEKGRQVRLMQAIYQQSEYTIVWLPLDRIPAFVVGSYMRRAPAAASVTEQGNGIPEPSSSTEPGNTTNADASLWKYEMYLHSHGIRSVIREFQRLGWFSRCWIIQEVALSRKSPVVLCGREMGMMWSDVEHFMHGLSRFDRHYHMSLVFNKRFQDTRDDERNDGKRQKENYDGLWYEYWEPRTHTQSVMNISEIRQWTGQRNNCGCRNLNLQSLLFLSRTCRASNTHDRIYSLLGIAWDTTYDAGAWPIELVPNYETPLLDLFVATARYCIRSTQSLFILQYFDHGPRPGEPTLQSLPSWVPRWHTSVPECSIIGSPKMSRNFMTASLLERRFNASKSRPSVMEETTKSSTLRLRGIKISSASTCLSPVREEDLRLRDIHTRDLDTSTSGRLRVDLARMLGECGQQISSMSTHELHMAFALTTNAYSYRGKGKVFTALQDFLRGTIIPLVSDLWLALGIALNTLTMMPLSSPLFWDPEPEKITTAPGWKYAVRAHRTMLNRRLFITRKGQLGLGPAKMNEGDVIVVLFGGDLPFVLRPMPDEQWQFIGPCYVYGIMNGEAVEGKRKKKDRRRWFDLV